MFENEHLEFLKPSSSRSSTESLFKILNTSSIRLKLLRRLSFYGLPDEPLNLRSIVWRILLDYLPLEPEDWKSELSRQRSTYEVFKSELLIVPDIKAESDHPLSMSSDSKWNAYFKDQDIWDIVEKDIKRTRMDMHFFFTPTDSSLTYEDILTNNYPPRAYARPYVTGYIEDLAHPFLEELSKNENIEKQADVIGRILFVYSKLNPGISYVQGMNELLAPIYYLFAHDTHPLFKGHAEADAFFCFTALMARVRDTFVGCLDSSESGLNGQLLSLTALIKRFDSEVHSMLETLEISPFYYAVKWIILLMSQELPLPDVFRLWDCLLAHDDPFEFLRYICLALVLRARESILTGDFAIALNDIQKFDIGNINELISEAEEYCKTDRINGF